MLVRMSLTNFLEILMKTLFLLWMSPPGMGLPLTERPEGGPVTGTDSQGLTGCQRDLAQQIQICLYNIVERFAEYNAAPEETRRALLRPMCREYGQSLQCVHLALLSCTPTDLHLNLIATSVGQMRQFMEDTCYSGTMEEEPLSTTTTPQTSTVKNTPHTSKIQRGYSFTINLTRKPATTTKSPQNKDFEQFHQDDPTLHGLDGSSMSNIGLPYPSILGTTKEPDLKSETVRKVKTPELVAGKAKHLAKNEAIIDVFYNSSCEQHISWIVLTMTLLVWSLVSIS